ncbi:MAG: PAAR domain-containing protein, partial [Pirellulales bacterium]|nr:PAAR domain-containing protein [Pirellulales bacterium]
AARMGDKATCASAPDVIMRGEPTVLIGSAPAARIGDQTLHGGVISVGCPTVHIGLPAPAGLHAGKSRCPGVPADKADEGIEKALEAQKKMLEDQQASLKRWNDDDQARFKKWFGATDEASRKVIQGRVDQMLIKNSQLTKNNFFPAQPPHDSKKGLFAYVYSNQEDRIFLGAKFCTSAVTGEDSKAGTLSHEMSHYNSLGKTDDVVYGKKGAEALAKSDPTKAMKNADNFQYYCEGL